MMDDNVHHLCQYCAFELPVEEDTYGKVVQCVNCGGEVLMPRESWRSFGYPMKPNEWLNEQQVVTLIYALPSAENYGPGAIAQVCYDGDRLPTEDQLNRITAAPVKVKVTNRELLDIHDGLLVIDESSIASGCPELVPGKDLRRLTPFRELLEYYTVNPPGKELLVVGFMLPYSLPVTLDHRTPVVDGVRLWARQMQADLGNAESGRLGYFDRIDQTPLSKGFALSVGGAVECKDSLTWTDERELTPNVKEATGRIFRVYNKYVNAAQAAFHLGFQYGPIQPLRNEDMTHAITCMVSKDGGHTECLSIRSLDGPSSFYAHKNDKHISRFHRWFSGGKPIDKWHELLASAKREYEVGHLGLATAQMFMALEIRIDSLLENLLGDAFQVDDGVTKINKKQINVPAKYTEGLKKYCGLRPIHEEGVDLAKALYQLSYLRNSYVHRADVRVEEKERDFTKRNAALRSVDVVSKLGEWDIEELDRKTCEWLHIQSRLIIDYVDSLT
jgi:hypothetical protein